MLIIKAGKRKSIKTEQAWGGLCCGAAANDDVFNSNNNSSLLLYGHPTTLVLYSYFTTKYN